MERPLSNVFFLFLFHYFFWSLTAWASSTMNQSEIRGLSRCLGTEPTLIFFVASFAFYGHEFSPSQTNLSYRVAASSSVVPTLSSLMKSLIKINLLNKFSFGPSQEDQGRKKTVHSMEGGRLTQHSDWPILRRTLCLFPCVVLCYYKPDESCKFSRHGNISLTGHFAVIHEVPMAFT